MAKFLLYFQEKGLRLQIEFQFLIEIRLLMKKLKLVILK